MAGRNFRPHIQIDLTSDCDDPSCYLRLILPFPSSNAYSRNISRENRRKLKVLLAVSIIQLSFCASPSQSRLDIVGCSTVSSLTGDMDDQNNLWMGEYLSRYYAPGISATLTVLF